MDTNFTFSSPEEIQQHITRLISQNEAILEPSPILTKRRTYTRQINGANGAQQQTAPSSSNLAVSYGQQLQQGGSPREFRSNSIHAAGGTASFSPNNVGGGVVGVLGAGNMARRHSVLAPTRHEYNGQQQQQQMMVAEAARRLASQPPTVIEEEVVANLAPNKTALKFLAQVEFLI